MYIPTNLRHKLIPTKLTQRNIYGGQKTKCSVKVITVPIGTTNEIAIK